MARSRYSHGPGHKRAELKRLLEVHRQAIANKNPPTPRGSEKSESEKTVCGEFPFALYAWAHRARKPLGVAFAASAFLAHTPLAYNSSKNKERGETYQDLGWDVKFGPRAKP